jgi:lauroyl/myristoyl acyltransferase
MSLRKATEICVFNSVYFFLGLAVFFVRIAPCRVLVINAMGTISGIVMMFTKIRKWRCIMGFAGNIGASRPGLFYVLRHFVQTGIDYVWGYLYYDPGSKVRQYFDVENREIIQQAFSAGKGVIVLSAHYGPLITTFMLNEMFGNIKRPTTADNFERWKKKSRYTIKPLRSKISEFLSDPKLNIVSGKSEKEMVMHVKKGGILFMYIDGPGPIRGKTVDFFGLRLNPHYFPFKLSLLYNVPVVFCSLGKKPGGGYLLRISRCSNFSSPNEGFTRYVSFLKALVCTNPFSWFLLPSVGRGKQRNL